MLEKLFLTAVEISLSTSLIIFPILIFTKALRKRFTTKWRYLIWFFLALRLIIPINLSIPETFFTLQVPTTNDTSPYMASQDISNNLETNNTANTLDTSDEKEASNEQLSLTTSKTNTTVKFESQKKLFIYKNLFTLKNLSLIWLLGILIYNLYQFTGYFIFKRNLKRWSQPITDTEILAILSNHCAEMNLTKKIKIMSCKKVSTPLVLGLL